MGPDRFPQNSGPIRSPFPWLQFCVRRGRNEKQQRRVALEPRATTRHPPTSCVQETSDTPQLCHMPVTSASSKWTTIAKIFNPPNPTQNGKEQLRNNLAEQSGARESRRSRECGKDGWVIYRLHRFTKIILSKTTVPATLRFLGTPISHLWKSVKSVDENSLSPLYSRPFALIPGQTPTLPSVPICAVGERAHGTISCLLSRNHLGCRDP